MSKTKLAVEAEVIPYFSGWVVGGWVCWEYSHLSFQQSCSWSWSWAWQRRESTPGVTLNRVNNPSQRRRSPLRNRYRSISDSTPHRRQSSTSRETLYRVKPMTSTWMNIFQDEDLFEEVRLGLQQPNKRKIEKPRLMLNRVKMAAKNKEAKTSASNAKKLKS